MALEPNSTKILIFFSDACVNNSPAKWVNQDSGVTEYDPVANSFTQPPTILFNSSSGLPGKELFGNATFYSDGYLYVYGTETGQHAFGGSDVYLARVLANPASWTVGANYQWYNKGSWTNASQAAKIVDGGNPASTSIAWFPSKGTGVYGLLAEIYDSFSILTSATPWGPWSPGPGGSLPDNCQAVSGTVYCYAISAHPELSTASQLTYSWYSPDDDKGLGHVRLGTISW
jgi:hypothetical protein